MKVKDIMTKDVVTVKSTDNVRDTLEKMRVYDINGTPVIDDSGCLVAMLVKADIFRFLIDPGHIGDSPVDWVMSKDLIYCSEDDDVLDVTKVIRKNNITSLPVVKDGKLVGIVSFEDLLDYFLEKIESIQQI